MAQAVCASSAPVLIPRRTTNEGSTKGCAVIVGPFASIHTGTNPTDDHRSVLDVIQIVTVIHANWWYLIQNYAMPQSLSIVPWCVAAPAYRPRC